MEEKLRNLSQNIAANTGAEHKPKKHNLEEETPWEDKAPEEEHQEDAEELQDKIDDQNAEESHNEPEEEVSDYTPEPEEPEEPHDEHHEESEKPEEEPSEQSADENPATDREATPIEVTEVKEEEKEPEETPEEEKKEPEAEEKPAEEPKEEHHEEEHHSEAKILTMETEDDEPKESPTRMKKYSPEVEAALSRLNSEEVAVDLNSEPLSTEPKKKHHGGRIFLFILFVIAVAAVALCVLVEQGIIDNPLNLLNKKSAPASSVVEPEKPAPEKELTDEKLIAEVDALFAEVRKNPSNYYIFKKSYQKTSDNEFVYYDVAEPSETAEKFSESTPTDCAGGPEGTDCTTVAEPVTNCAGSNLTTEEGATTNCVTAIEAITAENYKNYPHFRYVFQKTEFGLYEFLERSRIANEEALNNVEK